MTCEFCTAGDLQLGASLQKTPFGLFYGGKRQKECLWESHFSRIVEITPHMDTADSVLPLLSLPFQNPISFFYFLCSVL